MAESSFPWGAGPGAGPPVFQSGWEEMATGWETDGIVAGATGRLLGAGGDLAVFGDSSGMQVKVPVGSGWLKGHFYNTTAQIILAIAANSSGNPRIDRVVLHADLVGGSVHPIVLTGTPAGSPIPPALTQSGSVWEVSLAQVAVANGAGTITAANVTDERSKAAGQPPGFAAYPMTAGAYAFTSLTASPNTLRYLDTGVAPKCQHVVPASGRVKIRVALVLSTQQPFTPGSVALQPNAVAGMNVGTLFSIGTNVFGPSLAVNGLAQTSSNGSVSDVVTWYMEWIIEGLTPGPTTWELYGALDVAVALSGGAIFFQHSMLVEAY